MYPIEQAKEMEEFVKTYALNRAKAHVGGLDGRLAIKEGFSAWDELQYELKKRQAGRGF